MPSTAGAVAKYSVARALTLTLALAHVGVLQAATVLILSDVSGPGPSALAAALVGVGNSVTLRPPPEFTWDGSNPALAGFNCVVHLNGATYYAPLPVSAQTLLETFVSGGGGFVGSQWNGYERAVGQQTSMNNLALQLWPFPDNCGGCTMTWTTVSGQAGHPVLTGIPSPFSFFADGHDAGAQVVYGVNPSTVLMRSPGGGPGVLVRQFGSGRVVNFSSAADYGGTQLTLLNPTIQALHINAVGWACGGPLFAGSAGCPPHRVHGHISTIPPVHSGTSHQHHGPHGPTLAANCPPHAPGHTSGLSEDDSEWVLRVPALPSVNDLSADGSVNAKLVHPVAGYQNAEASQRAQAGDVVELYGPAGGLFLDEADQTPATGFTAPAAASPLYHTSELPEVRIGGFPAQVLFSGLAPGQSGIWQINVLVPPTTPVGSLPLVI